MKKTIILVTLAIISSVSTAQAAKQYGMAGCGLGNLIFKKNTQILAATTNGTAGSQIFGITSGTSNCTDDGTVAMNKELPVFVEANQTSLATDIARGSGETVANLSAVLGCRNAGHLASALQKNYSAIFPAVNTTPEQVTESIRTTVISNEELNMACRRQLI
jgi:hypothetical protein